MKFHKTWVCEEDLHAKPCQKALDVSSATARVAPDLLEAQAILSDTTVRRSAVDQEDLKPYRKSENRPHFSRWSTVIYRFFKDFTNHRKKTNRALVFSSRPFPNILKYREHCRLQHMKNKRMQQSHASSPNSQAMDVWKVARHPSSRWLFLLGNYSFLSCTMRSTNYN